MCAKSLAALPSILDEIRTRGPITFARYMTRALYDPESGFYGGGRARIGRAGDFLTSVSAGPVFGQVLASQFRELWERLEKPSRFTIAEQGAFDGRLAVDILAALPDLSGTIDYRIIEPLPALRMRQQEALADCPVKWMVEVEELDDFTGIHFSNELVDAMPFHLVRSNGKGWEELFVVENGNGLDFRSLTASAEISSAILRLPRRPAGTLAELRPAAATWISRLAPRLIRGCILVIDYGFPRDQLLAPGRTDGTFCCYRGHRRDSQPLDEPGEKDITAHVDFTSLAEAAVEAGLQVGGFTDQHHFLVAAAEPLLRSIEGPPTPASQKTLRTLQTLMHPASMGMQFHFLALHKGLDEPLSGFRFARPAGLIEDQASPHESPGLE